MFEVGRVCLKLAGREAGNYCVIVKKMDEKFVMVTGPKSLTKVKRRRCNINHLEPIEEKVRIKSEASDSEVLKAYQEASLLSRLGFEKPKKGKKAEKHEAKPAEKKEGTEGRKEKPEHREKHKPSESSKKPKGKKKASVRKAEGKSKPKAAKKKPRKK